MTDESIPRFKDLRDLSPAEHAERMKTGKLPETPQYIAAKAQALADAGLQDDTPPAKDLADMSVEDHYADIMRRDR